MLPHLPVHFSHPGLLPHSYTDQALFCHRAFAHAVPPPQNTLPSLSTWLPLPFAFILRITSFKSLPRQVSFPHIYLFFSLFCLFRATCEAYGSSQDRVESEQQLPAYATAIVMPDPSHLCDLYHSLRQHQILNTLSKTGDQTCSLRVLYL